MLLYRELLNELGSRCCTSTAQDFKTILSRYEHEGEEFLSITLPSFGKDFEKSLARGQVDRSLFLSFHKDKRGWLPAFLSGFTGRVFDLNTGSLLAQPDASAILAVRQITLMCGKMVKECAKKRTKAALSQFISTEHDVKMADRALGVDRQDQFLRISSLLFADVFSKVTQKVVHGEIIPKHGPGSTADGLLGNEKYDQVEWTRRLNEVFPITEYLIPSVRHWKTVQSVDILEPGQERPVKVTPVPKTQKTPRLIAIEPTCMQYVQQGLAEAIEEAKSTDDLVPLFVRKQDQNPNRELARMGSLNGELATLDLSEASDRVSYQHVRLLLTRFSHLREAVDACRSRKADVPEHGVIRLAKFASMGSALTFPIEEMVFLSIIFCAIESMHSEPLTRASIRKYAGRVRVYGDDIIVPVETVPTVILYLEAFGIKVNKDKSFWTGKFRESCGKEFYDGFDVSYTKLRRDLPTGRQDVLEILSAVSFRNHLYEMGFRKTTEFLDGLVGSILRYYPLVTKESPVLGRVNGDYGAFGFDVDRHDPNLQRPLVRGYVVRARLPHREVDGLGALLKVFLKRGDLPFADREHLVRSGRPQDVSITLGWHSPV